MRQLVSIVKNSLPKNIVVIGDLMLDEYIIGVVERISPEAPVPVFREDSREFSFGGATNVAINCKHVGCDVSVIGLLGKDDYAGKTLTSMLVGKKILSDGIVKSPDRLTTRKKRIVSQQQQILRVDSENAYSLSQFERDSLVCKVYTVIKPGSVVLISDYAKGVIDEQIVGEIMVRAKNCGSTVIADPKGPDFSKYKGVNYIKPNYKEFYQMIEFFGLDSRDGELENSRKTCEILSLDGIIITMGDKGLRFISEKDDIFYSAHRKEVYDITGAGDTVLAFLGVGVSCGLSMPEALKLANLAASVSVSHHKTYAVGLDELLEIDFDYKNNIYSEWKALKSEINLLRSEKNKKIVFTNGCFDILHSGHIFLLKEAKKRGDILIVGLNTDDTIKKLKGEARPVKTLEERAQILSAIDFVDYVVPFDQDTPYKLIDCLRPDVLIKGGDYKLESIVGYDLVNSYGGTVEVVEYKAGLSTTNIINNCISEIS